MILEEKQFEEIFNNQWCWRVVKMVHLGEDGAEQHYHGVLAGLVPGRAEQHDFLKITKTSRVPPGDYLFLQGVTRSGQGKPVFTRLFVNITGDMVYDVRPGRVLILTGREVLGFYPAAKEAAGQFLNLEGCRELLEKLAGMAGKDPAGIYKTMGG